MHQAYMRVLIETYWNVKVLPEWLLSYPLLRINRNILECKGKRYVNNKSTTQSY